MIPAWIGWLVVILVIAAFIVVFVAQRRRKARQVPSHHIILLDAFPVTHVPVGAVLDRAEARGVVESIKEAYRATWAALKGIYGVTVREAPIDTIGMSLGIVSKNHHNVVWFVPSSKMRLRFQDSMQYHFAGELHNMFRYNLYGIEWIYKSKNKVDIAHITKALAWIDKQYGNIEGEEI